MNWPRIKENVTFYTVVMIFVVVIVWGVFNGIKAARSKSILNDARTITTALQYFFEDQDRYPTGLEFTDDNLMAPYLSNLPAQEFPDNRCTQSFNYSNPFPRQFQLDVCLSKGIGSANVGWNLYSKSQ